MLFQAIFRPTQPASQDRVGTIISRLGEIGSLQSGLHLFGLCAVNDEFIPAAFRNVSCNSPTTAFTCICQSRPISRSAKSGLLPSIKWSRLSHAQSSPDISASGTMIALGLLEKRGNVYAISSALPCR